MAIDDVVSDFEEQISSGSSRSIQPGAGDEWLLLEVIVEAEDSQMQGQTDAGPWQAGWFGGYTGNNDRMGRMGTRPIAFFMTNSEYIRIKNNSGTTANIGFAAIKTKE